MEEEGGDGSETVEDVIVVWAFEGLGKSFRIGVFCFRGAEVMAFVYEPVVYDGWKTAHTLGRIL